MALGLMQNPATRSTPAYICTVMGSSGSERAEAEDIRVGNMSLWSAPMKLMLALNLRRMGFYGT
jgi:hypothetical protein